MRWAMVMLAAVVVVVASPTRADFETDPAPLKIDRTLLRAEIAYEVGDYATALELFRPLAEQGNPSAQFHLGLMYDDGRGVPQDDTEASRWFRRAAEQGHAKAQFNLGVMYTLGEGVPQDDKEAVRWYRLAAEQGVARAQYNLGSMYGMGQGVPQDYVQAHMWVNLAAVQGNGKARKARDRLAEKMTPAQRAEAQRLAREWKPKSK